MATVVAVNDVILRHTGNQELGLLHGEMMYDGREHFLCADTYDAELEAIYICGHTDHAIYVVTQITSLVKTSLNVSRQRARMRFIHIIKNACVN